MADKTGPHTAVVEIIADTGAQSNVWGFCEFENAGFSVDDHHPSTLKICAANTNLMNIIGQFEGVIKGQSPSGDLITCQVLARFLHIIWNHD